MARSKPAFIEFEDEAKEDAKLPAKFKNLASEGIEIDLKIKALKKRQDEIKSLIKGEFGEKEKYTLHIPEVGTVPVVPKEEVVIADAARLKEILGPEFDHYVKTGVSFKALPPLVDLVNDQDRPTHDLVFETVTFKETCALSFKAAK
ncbi:MAG: hypothetical protein C9356_12360 [Oleiphilus sp.]|nr:MAG: hypothetical protein C9356_12360 [Oleiphilus sp.]